MTLYFKKWSAENSGLKLTTKSSYILRRQQIYQNIVPFGLFDKIKFPFNYSSKRIAEGVIELTQTYWSAPISNWIRYSSLPNPKWRISWKFVTFSEDKNFLLKRALASKLVITIQSKEYIAKFWFKFNLIQFFALVLINYPDISRIFKTVMWIVRTK